LYQISYINEWILPVKEIEVALWKNVPMYAFCTINGKDARFAMRNTCRGIFVIDKP
jgi:hypothetical protein